MTPETDMNDDTRATPAQAVTAAIERIAAQWGGRMYAGPGGYVDIGRDIRAAAQAGPAEAQQPAKPPQAPSAAYIDELLCELDIDGGAYIDEGDRATVRRWLAGFGGQAAGDAVGWITPLGLECLSGKIGPMRIHAERSEETDFVIPLYAAPDAAK